MPCLPVTFLKGREAYCVHHVHPHLTADDVALLQVDKLKQKLLPEVNVTQSPPPPMPVSGAPVSGAPVSGAPVSGGISGQQQGTWLSNSTSSPHTFKLGISFLSRGRPITSP